MLSNEKRFTKLSKEFLLIFLLDFAISFFAFFFLKTISNGIFISYCDNNNIVLQEIQEINIQIWIASLSFAASTAIFIILFLVLIGQKLSYLREILTGIDALTAQRLNFEIPVRYNNEFTQLAMAINEMSKAELELKEKEAELVLDRENFIRAMSHDIRTPLTAILSHTDYLKAQDHISDNDLEVYLDMTKRKALQIKELTDMLLEDSNAVKEIIPDGKLLFVQLVDEWTYTLEEEYDCSISIEDDIDFKGEYKIQDFQRIFDNLSSNIKKYADPKKPVSLRVFKCDGRIAIEEVNYKGKVRDDVESYKIGLESIRIIAKRYGGTVEITETEETFKITILLFSI